MTINVNDVLRVAVIHDNDPAGEVVNQYQFRFDGPATITDTAGLGDVAYIIEQLYNIVVNMINIRNVLREVGVFNVTQNRLVGVTDANTYVGGTGIGTQMPPGTAALATFKTNVPKVILRKFLPPFASAQLASSGALSGTAQTAVEAFAAALLPQQISGSNRYQYGYLSSKTLSFEVPSIAIVGATIAYQRRRKPGVGA